MRSSPLLEPADREAGAFPRMSLDCLPPEEQVNQPEKQGKGGNRMGRGKTGWGRGGRGQSHNQLKVHQGQGNVTLPLAPPACLLHCRANLPSIWNHSIKEHTLGEGGREHRSYAAFFALPQLAPAAPASSRSTINMPLGKEASGRGFCWRQSVLASHVALRQPDSP